MKKILSTMTALIVTLVLIIGVGNGQASYAADKTKLTAWHYYEGSAGKVFGNLCAKFNASQSKYEVVSEYLPRAELTKQYTIGIVAGKLPDIGIVDNPDMASFSAMGLFEDITPQLKSYNVTSKFFPGPLKSTIYNGKNYGIPLGSNCLALYYNVDMLKKAGVKPPQTWTELTAACKKLTKKGVYGLAISAPKNEEGTFQYLPWLLSSGGSYDKLSSAQSIKSVSYLADLVKKGYMSKEVINWTQADVEKQFATGKAAMMVNGPWNLGVVKADAPKLKFSVVKVPKDKVFASVLGGENIGIIKGKNVEGGWEFLKFISDYKNAEEFANDAGYFPSRSDVASKSKYWNSDPIMKVYMDQMKYAMPRGPHPKWPQISDAISTALQQALTGQKTPAAAMNAAQVKVKKVLK